MRRRIDFLHSGGWTSTQVVQLVQALVCPTCEVREINRSTTDDLSANASGERRVSVRIDGRTVWLDERAPDDAPPETPPHGQRP